MRQVLIDYLPWLLSVNTLWSSFLAGEKDLKAWVFALLGQVGWSVWVIADSAWGLVPLNIGLWIIYSRNYIKWRRDAQ